MGGPALAPAVAGGFLQGASLLTIAKVFLVGGALAYSLVNRPAKPKGLKPADLLRIQLDKIAARDVIYGERRVGGKLVYWNAVNPQATTRSHFVLALGVGEYESLEGVYLEGQFWPLKSDPSGPNAYRIDAQGVSGDLPYENGYLFDFFSGTEDQAESGRLAQIYSSTGEAIPVRADFDGTSRARGVAYVVITCDASVDKVLELSLPPDDISFIVRGRKVYDPRKDSTLSALGGSGSHRLWDSSTWEWSQNPALCALDYVKGITHGDPTKKTVFGLGLYTPARYAAQQGPDEFMLGALPGYIAAANACDETIDIDDGEGGTVAVPKFTCDAVIEGGTSYAEVMRVLTDAMGGYWAPDDGFLKVWAGKAGAIADTYGDEIYDLSEPRVDAWTPLDDIISDLQPQFIGSTYEPTDGPFINSPAAESQLGNSRLDTLRLDAVRGQERASIITRIRLNELLQRREVIFERPIYDAPARVGERIDLTSTLNSLVAGRYRVQERRISGLTDEGVPVVQYTVRSFPDVIYDIDSGDLAAPDAGFGDDVPVTDSTNPNDVSLPIDAIDVVYDDGTPVEDLQPDTPGADNTFGAPTLNENIEVDVANGFPVSTIGQVFVRDGNTVTFANAPGGALDVPPVIFPKSDGRTGSTTFSPAPTQDFYQFSSAVNVTASGFAVVRKLAAYADTPPTQAVEGTDFTVTRSPSISPASTDNDEYGFAANKENDDAAPTLVVNSGAYVWSAQIFGDHVADNSAYTGPGLTGPETITVKVYTRPSPGGARTERGSISRLIQPGQGVTPAGQILRTAFTFNVSLAFNVEGLDTDAQIEVEVRTTSSAGFQEPGDPNSNTATSIEFDLPLTNEELLYEEGESQQTEPLDDGVVPASQWLYALRSTPDITVVS